MVDFAKLRHQTAEQRTTARQEQQCKWAKEDSANKFILEQLTKMVDEEEITDQYDIDFVKSVQARFKQGYPLTEKQTNYLYKMFHEKY